jgi:hypothetical protein
MKGLLLARGPELQHLDATKVGRIQTKERRRGETGLRGLRTHTNGILIAWTLPASTRNRYRVIAPSVTSSVAVTTAPDATSPGRIMHICMRKFPAEHTRSHPEARCDMFRARGFSSARRRIEDAQAEGEHAASPDGLARDHAAHTGSLRTD